MNTSPDSAPIALIGGTGALPAALVRALSDRGRGVVLCELDGFPFEGVSGHARRSFRLEGLAGLLHDLKAQGVEDVCFSGAIRRPMIDPARVTPESAPLVARLAEAMRLGDDGALRTVIAIFEEAGLRVVGASEIAPDLLPPAGVLAPAPVYDGLDAHIAAARVAHADLAAKDAGQAVVVRNGAVAAREGIDGTDAMLASLSREATGGLLYKAPKAEQDRRVDLPVIGPGTVEAAAAAGLSWIVIEAGGVMILDREETVRAATRLGVGIDVRQTPETAR